MCFDDCSQSGWTSTAAVSGRTGKHACLDVRAVDTMWPHQQYLILCLALIPRRLHAEHDVRTILLADILLYTRHRIGPVLWVSENECSFG